MRIPKNKEVKNCGDVQNVITSVILRQKGMFTREDIFEEVEANIEFSPFGKHGEESKDVDVKKMIDETIDILWQFDNIVYNDNQKKYYVHINFPSLH